MKDSVQAPAQKGRPQDQVLEAVAHGLAPWAYIPPVPYDGDDEDLEGSFYTPGGIEDAAGYPVCLFGDSAGSGTMFENAANARLIAAAPDLLEALKELRGVGNDLKARKAARAKADAAIAKATGDQP